MLVDTGCCISDICIFKQKNRGEGILPTPLFNVDNTFKIVFPTYSVIFILSGSKSKLAI